MQQPYIIEARAIEWLYVLKALLKGYTPNSDFMIGSTAEGFAIYTIPRHLIPSETLAKALGASEELVTSAVKIELKAEWFDRCQKDWQRPTVDYCGEA